MGFYGFVGQALVAAHVRKPRTYGDSFRSFHWACTLGDIEPGDRIKASYGLSLAWNEYIYRGVSHRERFLGPTVHKLYIPNSVVTGLFSDPEYFSWQLISDK